MFVQQLNELITDLSDPETSPFTISRLLTIKTLSRLDVVSVVFHEVTASATLKKVSSFGISDPELASWTELPLSSKFPITDSIKQNKVVWLTGTNSWKKNYPQWESFPHLNEAKTFISVPLVKFTSPVGTIGFFSSREIESEPQLEAYLLTVAKLVSFVLYRNTNYAMTTPRRGLPDVTKSRTLGPRKKQVLNLISQNKTNSQIADLLGFSESTIRQETIQIYEILGVSGRVEARNRWINNPDEFS